MNVDLPSLNTVLAAGNGKKGEYINPVDVGDKSSQASSDLSSLTSIDNASMGEASCGSATGWGGGCDNTLEGIGQQST